mgnify:CR=1 FL=1
MTNSSPSLRTRLAALLALVSALAGAGLSAWLTRIKFRRDFLCDGSGCLGGNAPSLLSCDQALDSPWSALLGVPWSLWSAAHAVVVAILAVALLRSRSKLARVVPGILLALGSLAVVVSLVLATYAWTHFDHLCRLCVCLYVYSGLVLLAATLMRASNMRWRDLVVDATRIVALLLSLMSLQTFLYRLAARHAECPGLAPELPSTMLVGPVDTPHAALLIFVDPSCERCRELHHLMQQPRLREALSGVEQRVYLVPRALCDERWMPAHEFVDAYGKELSNDDARNHDACLAARALYCIERLHQGAGMPALSAVFALQESRAEVPYFTFVALEGALREAGLLDGDVGPLRDCIDGDEVAQEIAEAQGYLRDWVQAHRGKLGLPQTFLVPIVEGRVDLRAPVQAHDADKLFHILQSKVKEP